MNIIIVQSTGFQEIESLLKRPEFKDLLKKVTNIFLTNSFEHALLNIPKKGKVFVITSNIFHDPMTKHRDLKNTIPNSAKNANTLAEGIKAINNRSVVYVYSDYLPHTDKYIDGLMKKTDDISRDLKVLLKIATKVF